MSELERLLDTECDAFERELLSAAADDPREAQRADRLIVALGLGGPVPPGGGGSAEGGGSATGSGSATGNAASGATQTTSALVAKAAAGAAVVGAVIWGAVALRGAPPTPSPAALATSAPAAVAPAVSVAPAPAPTPSAAPPATTSAVPTAARPRASAPRQPKNTTPQATASGTNVTNASQLAREVQALARARAALAAGDPARARRELNAYDAAFPNGILAPEARTLRARIDSATQNP
ncbi:MAG: hypothetical protein KC776_26900 [Myxococcales bacterium]|nr:hypothetical protein [Myxococcales bacterium]